MDVSSEAISSTKESAESEVESEPKSTQWGSSKPPTARTEISRVPSATQSGEGTEPSARSTSSSKKNGSINSKSSQESVQSGDVSGPSSGQSTPEQKTHKDGIEIATPEERSNSVRDSEENDSSSGGDSDEEDEDKTEVSGISESKTSDGDSKNESDAEGREKASSELREAGALEGDAHIEEPRVPLQRRMSTVTFEKEEQIHEYAQDESREVDPLLGRASDVDPNNDFIVELPEISESTRQQLSIVALALVAVSCLVATVVVIVQYLVPWISAFANCVVPPFSEWSACSVSCGRGFRTRRRSLPPSSCSSVQGLSAIEKEVCELHHCLDSPCIVGRWFPWIGCDLGDACGPGVHASRFRKVLEPSTIYGPPCAPLVETQPCIASQIPCSSDCSPHVGDWHDWTPCSAMCDVGLRHRVRRMLTHGSFARWCSAKTKEKQYCQPEGRRICHVVAVDGTRFGGFHLAKVWHAPDMRDVASQRFHFVGLRVAKQWRVLEITSAQKRDDLISSLDEHSGEVLRPMPYDDVDLGWTLSRVGKNPSRGVSELRKCQKFPTEVEFESSGDAIVQRWLHRCLRTWLAGSILTCLPRYVSTEAGDWPKQDVSGGISADVVASVRYPN